MEGNLPHGERARCSGAYAALDRGVRDATKLRRSGGHLVFAIGYVEVVEIVVIDVRGCESEEHALGVGGQASALDGEGRHLD